MRLILSSLVLVIVLAAGGGSWASDGAEIFATLKCGMCHKPDKKTAAISLAEIVQTYSDKAKLVSFFKGEKKPLIENPLCRAPGRAFLVNR